MRQPKPSVLLISHEVIGKAMAGPGIRYYHIARILSQQTNLTLATRRTAHAAADSQLFTTHHLDLIDHIEYGWAEWEAIATAAATADVIILPSDTAAEFPQLAEVDAALVIDGYNPLLAEWLAQHQHDKHAQTQWQQRHGELAHQFRIGDFFLCASERQRDWWLGLLEAHGRLNPATFGADPSLRNLIAVVPYGLPQTPPRHTRPILRGVWPGIQPQDKLVLWGGGLWTWLDPLTAIRALDQIWQTRQDIKLVFPGTRHPNPALEKLRTHLYAVKHLADALNLTDRAVFFGDWVPYEDWANVLLECDVALTLHFDTLETRLAFRSRALEYIWAGLPMVATEGDAISEVVAANNLGVVVGYQDVDAIAHALCQLTDEGAEVRAAHFAEARTHLTWERCVQPLVDFCRHPQRAADRALRPPQEQAAHSPKVDALTQENERLRQLILGYERGRFIRIMRFIKQFIHAR